MVKADIRTDYYAALGVTPSSEVEEIKKQFRKLALKYHPDRNPGKELEFNAKFQTIQAAHEILTDSRQRLKYDTDRLRAGYGRVSGPPKTNAGQRQPQPRKTPFPSTPPQRPPPNPHHWANSGTYSQPPPSAGAQRYAGYARAGSAKWDRAGYEEAKTRADAYHGFQEMKNSRNTAPGWTNFDPRTGHPVPPGAGPNPNTKAQKPQSAYEAFFGKHPSSGPQRAQSTRKKSGFTPWTPGGDEPMARDTSAYVHNSPKVERSQGYFEPASPATSKRPSQDEHSASSVPNLQRASSRYASVGGEKTNLASDGARKPANAHSKFASETDSRPHTNPPSPTYLQSDRRTRHHSASPQMKPRRNPPVSPSSTSSSSDTDEVLPNFRPKAVPRSRKFAESSQSTKHPHSGENTHGVAVAFGPDSWLLDEPTGLPKTRNTRGESSQNWNANYKSSGTDNQSPHPAPFSVPTSFPAHPSTKPDTNTSRGTDGGANAKSSASNGFTFNTEKPSHAKSSYSNEANSDKGSFFGAGFPNSDLSGGFKAGEASQPHGIPVMSKDETRSKAQDPNIHSTLASETPDKPPQRGPQPTDNETKPKPAFVERKFSPDQWQDAFNPNTWSVPQSDPPQQRRTEHHRQRSPKKHAKAVPKQATTPKPATVSTDTEEAEATYTPSKDGADSPQNSSSAAEVMDIDETPSATRPQQVPHQSAVDQNATPETGKGKQTSKTNLFDLNNLGSVAPFTSTNSGGIDDLKDLTSTLPFESKPASNSSNLNIRPRDLALPKLPKTPGPPNFFFDNTKPGAPAEPVLPQSAWDHYIAEMGAYMYEWNDFNRKMLGHFNARQELVETGLSPNWMRAVGDSSRLQVNSDGDTPEKPSSSNAGGGVGDDEQLVAGQAKGGFGAYLRGVEEDFVVREHWSVAWERHRDCIHTLGKVREWIRSGGKIR